MKPTLRPGPLAAVSLVLAVLISGGPPAFPSPPASGPGASMEDGLLSFGAGANLSPLTAELVRIVETERLRLAEVRRSLLATRDVARRLELERRLEAIKLETEVGLLRAQASHARREGRVEVAETLEASILLLLAPPARGIPIERPAPASAAPSSAAPSSVIR